MEDSLKNVKGHGLLKPVPDNQMKTFETLPVEFYLESLSGKIKQKVFAYTTNRITGNMRSINWKKCKDK